MSSYIDSKPKMVGGRVFDPGHSWEEQAARRLTWLYGSDRAGAISAGHDPHTQADISAWYNLGKRKTA